MGFYKTINHKTLDDLVSHILPTRNGKNSRRRIELQKGFFRGQWDSNWALLPTCARKNGLELYATKGVSTVEMEIELVKAFSRILDSFGFDMFAKFGTHVEDILNDPLSPSFPDRELVRILALAQHHGLPTRLLDITKNPLVAMLFSALDIYKSEKQDGKLAIWFFPDQFNQGSGIAISPGVPSLSGNIKGQSGHFMYLPCDINKAKSSEKLRNHQYHPPLDELFVNQNKIVEKHTLPQSESKNLISYCRLSGVSEKTIFPSLDGAAKETINRWHDGEFWVKNL